MENPLSKFRQFIEKENPTKEEKEEIYLEIYDFLLTNKNIAIRVPKEFKDFLKNWDSEAVENALRVIAQQTQTVPTAEVLKRGAKLAEERKAAESSARKSAEKHVQILLKPKKPLIPVVISENQASKLQKDIVLSKKDLSGYIEQFAAEATAEIPEGPEKNNAKLAATLIGIEFASQIKNLPVETIEEAIPPISPVSILSHLAKIQDLEPQKKELLEQAGFIAAAQYDFARGFIEKVYGKEIFEIIYGKSTLEELETTDSSNATISVDLDKTTAAAKEIINSVTQKNLQIKKGVHPAEIIQSEFTNSFKLNLSKLDFSKIRRFFSGVFSEVVGTPNTFHSLETSAPSVLEAYKVAHPKAFGQELNLFSLVGFSPEGVSVGIGPISKTFGGKATKAAITKLAGTTVGKAAVATATMVSGKVATVLAGLTGPVGVAVMFVATEIVGRFLGWILPKVWDFVKKAAVFILGGGILLLLGGNLFVGGLLTSVGGAGLIASGAGIEGITSGVSSLLGFTMRGIFAGLAKPLIGFLIGFPILVALILFIINSGAYVVPPSAGTVGGNIYTGPLPEECPSSWPFTGGAPFSVQGPYTTDTHFLAEAVDLSISYQQVVSTHKGVARIFPTDSGAFGKHVEIESICNGKQFYSRYAHFESVSIGDGTLVEKGAPLGISGNTGFSTGPHLHYEFRYSSPDTPTGGLFGTFANNPPFMAKSFIPQNAIRGCVSPNGPTCLEP